VLLRHLKSSKSGRWRVVGLSLLWDKVLPGRRTATIVVSYVFWIGAMSILALVLLPFGFEMPRASVAVTTSVGALDLIATYFYYAPLKSGRGVGRACRNGWLYSGGHGANLGAAPQAI